MNDRRAQDILRHIIQDKDYGFTMVDKLPTAEAVYVVSTILPNCLKQAEEKENKNDIGFFTEMIKRLRPLALLKLKYAERLWVAYDEATGYPLYIDGAMVVLYDYAHAKEVSDTFIRQGYQVSIGKVNDEQFKDEIGHMFRNGYQKIMFTDGKALPFIVEREELFTYDKFYSEEFLTNPALSAALIDYFQEIRSLAPTEGREEIINKRQMTLIAALNNAEFMVPCIKEEKEDEEEISFPFIDVTEKLGDNPEDGQIVAIPVFTDAFEMYKCYEGHEQHIVYTFRELIEVVEEVGASGIIINALGISYFMGTELMKAAVLEREE